LRERKPRRRRAVLSSVGVMLLPVPKFLIHGGICP
jgi:hypothetical protein